MHSFDQDACDLLRQGAMLECGAAAERFFKLVGHIGAYEYTFTVSHIDDVIS